MKKLGRIIGVTLMAIVGIAIVLALGSLGRQMAGIDEGIFDLLLAISIIGTGIYGWGIIVSGIIKEKDDDSK